MTYSTHTKKKLPIKKWLKDTKEVRQAERAISSDGHNLTRRYNG